MEDGISRCQGRIWRAPAQVTPYQVWEMLPLRQQIHKKCRVSINYWTDVEEVDNLLAPRGSPCPPECPDSRGKSSKMSRDLPANQTIILAVNQIVWSLCDTSKTSSEPLLLTVLVTLLCYVPAACWPSECISGRRERSRLAGSAFVVCVLAAAGRGSCAGSGVRPITGTIVGAEREREPQMVPPFT